MSGVLPYDYEVEYIESTGAQYIAFPITDTNCYGFDLSVTDVATTGYNVYVGNGTSNDFCVCVNNGNINSTYIRIRTALTWANSTGATKRISAKNGIITANGANVGTYDASLSLGNNNNAMGIFAYSNGILKSVCRVMSYKLYGAVRELLLDVIPVRFTNELGVSEGAMYDKVSGRLFRNAGTGAFVIGPDKAATSVPVMGLHFMRRPGYTAKDYVQDGLVAMWDGIENAGWGVHDAEATTWKDLIGNGDMSLTYGSMTFSESACVVTNGLLRTTLGQIATALNGKEITVEAVYVATGRGYPIIAPNSSPALNIWNNGGNSMLFNIFGSNIGDLGWMVTVRDSSTPPLSHLVYAVSESDGNCRGYLDGALKKTDTLPATLTTGYSTAQDFGIGNSSSSGMSFDGQMSAMRIYSRALTAAEIANNYAVDKERFNLP